MTKKATFDLRVKREQAAVAEKMLGDALPDTRAFSGCISVEVMRDSDEPDRWFLMEEWESRAHHQAYVNWRVETGWVESFAANLDGEPALRYFDPVDM